MPTTGLLRRFATRYKLRVHEMDILGHDEEEVTTSSLVLNNNAASIFDPRGDAYSRGCFTQTFLAQCRERQLLCVWLSREQMNRLFDEIGIDDSADGTDERSRNCMSRLQRLKIRAASADDSGVVFSFPAEDHQAAAMIFRLASKNEPRPLSELTPEERDARIARDNIREQLAMHLRRREHQRSEEE